MKRTRRNLGLGVARVAPQRLLEPWLKNVATRF